MLKVRMTAAVALTLETAVSASNGREFSGFGFIQHEKDGVAIYDVVVLHVGSEAYTEIDTEKIIELSKRPDSKNMRVWFHRHPIGNAVPGPHNWSPRDNQTIRETPLGGFPELVKWSISIVRTPKAWIGRVDNHLTKETHHIPVFPLLPDGFVDNVKDMIPLPKFATVVPQKKEGSPVYSDAWQEDWAWDEEYSSVPEGQYRFWGDDDFR